jgi:hypothetical protein
MGVNSLDFFVLGAFFTLLTLNENLVPSCKGELENFKMALSLLVLGELQVI